MIHYPVRWFALRQGARRGGVATPNGLQRIVANHLDWNLYWALNCDSAGALRPRARSCEVLQWCNILLDIDPVDQYAKPHMAAQEVLQRVKGVLGNVNPWVVDSGRGVQLILELQPQSILGHAHRMRVRAAVGAFFHLLSTPGPVHGCVLDTSCSDLSRVARLPGSINSKTGRTAAVLSEGEPLGVEAMRTLQNLGKDWQPTEIPKADGPWKARMHLIPDDTLQFLSEGVATPLRHKMAFKAAAFLHDLCLPETNAVEYIATAAARCHPPLPSDEAARCVRNAYRKEQYA